MPARCSGHGWRRLWAAGIAATLALFCAPELRAQNYIQDDAKISGSEVYTFADGPDRVTVVLGSFQFSAGSRRVTANDAVLWIHAASAGRGERHDIVIYAEGGAAVSEGGTTTTDSLMLVEVHVQGGLRLARPPVEKSLADFPLYVRAKEARSANRVPLSTTRPVAHEAPPLVIAMRPPGAEAPAAGAEKPSAAAEPNKPAAAKPIVPVFFHADNFVSKKAEKGHVLIATGNVYLWQGGPGSKATLELRSQAAVVFLEPAEAREPGEAGAPVAKVPSLGGDANSPGERIVGVYLVDDVILSRGERYMRGPEAYYDFTTDRAIVRDPVFRTIQDPRGIPIFVRAEEGRLLSRRETWFRDAEISTSDFYTPTYYIHADKAYFMDETHYDQEGVRVGPPQLSDKLTGTSLVVRDVPIFYWPYSEGDVTEENLAIRKVQVGSDRGFGAGVETEWYLFRLLGLVAPVGFSGTAELNAYARGEVVGANLKYARQSFSGYSKLYGIQDRNNDDDFGDVRQNLSAPEWRGWLLERHKQILDDWEVQFELSWISDQNFLERFFPSEFYGGKEQETLLYAKKQQDNWAFTSLLEYRLNRFDTQTESYPDLGLFLEGEPLGDRLTWYSENHAGLVRLHAADGDANFSDSDVLARGDTRQEVDFPLHLGPVNLTHYAVGRLTGWSDSPPGGETFRPYGQVGVKVDTHLWKQDQSVESRIWDVHGLRHVITPEAQAMLSTTGGVESDDLFPLDPGIEEDLTRMQMWSAGVSQRLQTRRGAPGEERTVDWMRLDVHAGFFYDTPATGLFPGDGRSFFSRPEDSLPRNHVTGEYQWQISDSTLFLADTNYDTDNGSFDRYDLGLCVQRDPRLEYFFGVRSMRELDSTVGTAGINYQLTEKYRLSLFEQYDFSFNNGHNYISGFTIARKIERWYGALSAVYNQTNNEVAVYLTFWPEGVPEMRMGTSRLNLLGSSTSN